MFTPLSVRSRWASTAPFCPANELGTLNHLELPLAPLLMLKALTFWDSAQLWLGVVLIPAGCVYLRQAEMCLAERSKGGSAVLLDLQRQIAAP